MINTRLRLITFILFFVHLMSASANCDFCKKESCKCNSLFKEIICNLEHEKQTPDSTQTQQTLPTQRLRMNLGSGSASGFGSGLLLSGGGAFGQFSTSKPEAQVFSNGLFDITTNKASLCQAMSVAQFSGTIQRCRDTLVLVGEFINMLHLMSDETMQAAENNTDWLSLFSSAHAYSLANATSTNAWVHLENGLWFFILITPNSNLAVLEWSQGNEGAYSINSFSTREQTLIFLAGKIDQVNCLSSGYYKKEE